MTNIRNCIPRLLISGLALAVALSGCGGEAAVEQTPGPTAMVQEDESASPGAGGALFPTMPSNVESFDPLLVNNSELMNLLSLVYEPMIKQDNTGVLSSYLAETWSTTDGGVTWTIQLRRGVSWHGSSELMTANDVLYTYQVLQSSAYEESPYRAQLEKIASIEAVDEYTVVVTGVTPGIDVLYALDFPIVSRKLFSENKGTGPYEITAADSSQGIILTANNNWWKRTPYITNVVAKCVEEGATALSLLSIRQINFAPTDSVTVSSYREEGVTNIIEVYTQHVELLYLNASSWRLTDPNVKKAIAYALDRREIISKCYYNHAVAVDVPVVPDSWLYDAASKIYDTDVSMAIQLLEESGWIDYDGDGVREKKEDNGISKLKLSLLVNNTPDNLVRKDVAQLIQSQLAAVGFDVEIIEASWTDTSTEYVTALSAGGFDMALAGIYLDESGDVSQLLSSGGSRNYSKYASEAMDSILNTQASDESEYRQKSLEMQKLFVEDLPFMMLYCRTYSVVHTSDLTVSTDIRYTDLFRSIEKWYFNARGRAKYTLEYAELDISGVPALKTPVLDEPDEEGGDSGTQEEPASQE